MRVNIFRPWTILFLASALAGLMAGCSPGGLFGAKPRTAARDKTAGGKAGRSSVDRVLSGLGAAQMHVQLKQATFTGRNRRGFVVWKLYTPLLEASPGPQTVRMRRVVGTLYKDGAARMLVHAPDATIDYKKSTLILSQGVTGQGLTQPEHFAADRVEWQWEQPDGLSATGHVRFQRGATIVTAGSLVGDVALKSGRLTDHPTVISPIPGV
ncbi:MAG TPA: hypothetical protein VFJ58_12170 [Armatimonadota bacterium]|nr:hypothetical protein [Armatimonadota bacterium]